MASLGWRDPRAAEASRKTPRSLPITLLALVFLSATFHTLIRSDLQATLRVSLQPTSLDDEVDSSAAARVSIVLAKAVQRGATEPSEPSPSHASLVEQLAARVERAAATSGAQLSVTAVESPPPPPLPSVAVQTAYASSPDAAYTSTPEATCAAAATACAACELRLLHWNLQHKPGKPDVRQLAAVLALAKARRYDVVSLNELALERAQVEALGSLLGFHHVALHQGRRGGRACPTSAGAARWSHGPPSPERVGPRSASVAARVHRSLIFPVRHPQAPRSASCRLCRCKWRPRSTAPSATRPVDSGLQPLEDTATPAHRVLPKPRAASTDARAPPQPRGSFLWPQERASACAQDEV
jgi:hypothetical protein